MSDSWPTATDGASPVDEATKQVEDMGLTDGTTEASNTEAEDSPPLDPEAAKQKVRDAGWTEGAKYNYEEFERTKDMAPSWLADAKVYEWKDEYGDVGPEVPELEEVLFNDQFLMKKGEHLEALDVEVRVEGPERVQPIKAFADAGLHPVVLSNVQKCGYTIPTPIQSYVIPIVGQGKDVVGNSQTGSGKTGAYLIPVISKLMGKVQKWGGPRPVGLPDDPRRKPVRAEPLVVVIVPTRELALQIFNEACRLCYRSMMRPCVMYGGLPLRKCIDELGKACDILIATPGRLCDVMDRSDVLSLERVRYMILDEADEMLDPDWEEEVNKIMGGTGDNDEKPNSIYMMFSATFPKPARRLARGCMGDDYYRVRIGRPGLTHKNIVQDVIWVDGDKKQEATFDLLCSMKPARTLIFCNSRYTVDHLDDFLYNRGLPTTSIHSGRNQMEREDALRNFRSGKAPVLITTGVSARGWDVKGIEHVINYDLPSTMYGGITEYIHRIGRTGRIGNQGRATSFYNDRDEEIAQDLVNVLASVGNPIPECLSGYTPEEVKVELEDEESDDEEEGGVEADGEPGWGESNGETNGAAEEPEGNGFTPDNAGFTPDAAAAEPVAAW